MQILIDCEDEEEDDEKTIQNEEKKLISTINDWMIIK